LTCCLKCLTLLRAIPRAVLKSLANQLHWGTVPRTDLRWSETYILSKNYSKHYFQTLLTKKFQRYSKQYPEPVRTTHSNKNMWTITFVFVIIKTLLYIRIGSTETLIGRPLFAIHLTLKIVNKLTVNQHCWLFSCGEPPWLPYTVKPGAHLPSQPESLGWTVWGIANVSSFIDNGSQV